jgi:3-oxoacyl-[acyl-carrier-protein] synthase II
VELSGRRVFITGSSILSGRVDRVSDLWTMAMSGEKSCGQIPGDPVLAHRIGLASGDASILARHQVLGLTVTEEAWKNASLGEVRNRIRGEGKKHRDHRFGCVGGSSLGGLCAMEGDFASRPDNRFSPYALSRWRGNAVSAVVSLRHGLSGTVLSVNAASATGAQILWMAGMLIRWGVVEVVVAVAADALPSERLSIAMGRNGSLAKEADSLPLSGERSGMTPAEGAACLILESETHASARSAVPLAEWLGGECRNEAHHLQAPDPEAVVLSEMINRCKEARLLRGRTVDWVSLHATGTSRFDALEVKAILKSFAEEIPWLSAFKRTTGHALSASGLMEVALLVEGLRSGSVPPALSGVDESLGLGLAGKMIPPVPQTAIQIGQGMGGDVVINLLGRAQIP